ncbi:MULTISPECIES: MFS transporter [Nocardia]|uniref:MFS transporter n=1 Tax=Nocardia abscessus TaxID=120957 RepID=UPI001893DC5F|nr:MFS transporter [Nocardia abscessus]MBF6475525.1 MFS transporter [Nocardia abscessus]
MSPSADVDAGTVGSSEIGTRLATVLAVACGMSVANVYYAQPLVERIGAELEVGTRELGLVTTLTQAGYLLGLVLLVPLGDLVDRRRLIVGLTAAAACGLAGVAVSRDAVWFFAASALVGSASVVVQVIVAYGAALSAPQQRGRVVGIVTGGVVIGILLARTVSGLIAEVAGWRAVFTVSAALMLGSAGALARLLPRDHVARARVSYAYLVTSVVRLSVREPVFRIRGLIGLLMFAGFGALWGSMALPLAAAPWHLSTGEIGMFAIAGAAGALGATRAGRLADRGKGQTVSAISLVLLTLPWAAIAATPHSLALLAVGVIVFDLAVQALHVTNQHLIVNIDPATSSRLIGSYMVYYSLGTGGGAVAATTLYSIAGWGAVCALGATLSISAATVWAVDRLRHHRASASCGVAPPHPVVACD